MDFAIVGVLFVLFLFVEGCLRGGACYLGDADCRGFAAWDGCREVVVEDGVSLSLLKKM